MCARPLSAKGGSGLSLGCIEKEDIQTVATDQCSFTLDQKALGRDDFTKIPGGLPGVQTRGTLLYTYGVRTGKITEARCADFYAKIPQSSMGYIRKRRDPGGS